MATRVEQIGKVIYGSQRLHSSLTSLIAWFAGKGGTPREFAGEFTRIADAINSLEVAARDLGGTGMPELEDYVEATRGLHLSLARFFEDVGYSGIPADLLRRQAAQL